MAEEFAFHELGRNRATVDRHKGRFGARPAVVDHAGNEFLAGARLTRDVHRRLRLRHLADHLPEVVHALRFAEQLRAARLARRSNPKRVLDDGAQVAKVQRLGNEIESAELESLYGRLDVAVRSDDGNRYARCVRLHPLNELQPIAVGQAHVGQADIEVVLAQQSLGAGYVHRGFCPYVHAAKRER